jgi:hypothetical protein
MAVGKVTTLTIPDLSPSSLPVRASLPFPRGVLADARRLTVRDARDAAPPVQARPLLRWPDGSVSSALLLFDPLGFTPPFRLVIEPTDRPAAPPLVRAVEGGLLIDAGVVSFPVLAPPLDVDERDRGILTEIVRQGAAVTGRRLDAGLLITENDGPTASSQKAGPGLAPSRGEEILGAEPPPATYGITIVEPGPVRALVRVEGRTARDAYRPGLDYVAYVEAYRNRSLVRLSLAWIHRDGSEAHFVRDMRFRIPLAFTATEAWIGTGKGPCRTAVRHGRRWSARQLSAERFEVVRDDWDGRRFDVASGAAGGRRGPGWAQLRSDDGRAVSVFLPGFADEHPLGISFTADSLDIELWPSEAAAALRGARILPPLLDGVPEHRHRKLAYECLAHHPYEAFLDPQGGCLKTVQGMQKTREIIVDCDPGIEPAAWARACEGTATEMPVAWPSSSRPAHTADTALAAAGDWFAAFPRTFGVSGAFNRGDIYYLVHDELDSGPWRRVLEEHARSGYWNNNEEDPVHGLFLLARHACSTERERVALLMARHLWDVDVRHRPPWGVHTHTEGHCFRSQTWSGTDHFWLEGLLDYYRATGLPDVLEGVRELARVAMAAIESLGPAESDLRTVSLAIAQAFRCAEALEEPGLAERARALAVAQAEEAMPEGCFTDYGSRTGRARSPSLLFGTLFLEAIGEMPDAARDPSVLRAAIGQIDWFLSHAVHPDGRVTDPADTWGTGAAPDPSAEDPVGGLQLMACCGRAWRWTGEARYRDAGELILSRFCRTFAPPLPGAGLGQIRPLVPATALRCIPVFLDAAAGSSR